MPSFILIHPTVRPQYTNVTDRQTDNASYSIGRTVLQTVAQKGAEIEGPTLTDWTKNRPLETVRLLRK